MPEPKTLVIVHGGCADGFAAAWVLRAAYPDAEFHFANYGEPPPDVTGKRVVMADFSYKRPVMLALIRAAGGRVTALDHHASAEKELAGILDEFEPFGNSPKPEIVFDMNKSGGRLAWEHVWDVKYGREHPCVVFPGGEIVDRARPPMLVRVTESRDLWRFDVPYTREITAAMSLYPRTFAVWDRLAEVLAHGAA